MTVNEKGLEPCPYCGEYPLVGGTTIWCANKACWGPHVEQYSDIHDAIGAWNRRAASKDAEPVAWRYRNNTSPPEPWMVDCAYWNPHRVAGMSGAFDVVEPLFTHPSTGADGGVKVKAQALLDALHRFGFPVSDAASKTLMDGGSLEAQRVHVAAVQLRAAILTAIEPVAASPGVGDEKRSPLDHDELLAITEHLMMLAGIDDPEPSEPDCTDLCGNRVCDQLGCVVSKWRRVHSVAAPTSPAPSPAGGDVLLADRLLGPVTEATLRLIAGAFRRDGEELGSERRPRFSIPTRPDHDDDCVVIDALKEAARALSSKQRSDKE